MLDGLAAVLLEIGPDALAEAGLPEGVFNVVNGDKVTVDALLDNEHV